jgi:hypothetical protein
VIVNGTGIGTITDDDTKPVTVAGRRLFYNNSLWDHGDPGVGADDDGAIAPDKTALLPGGTATLANYTSYSRGINGVMLDLDNYVGTPTAADFTFKVGNDNMPAGWAAAPAPASISVHSLAGTQKRITFTWPDGAIRNQWLQVTAKTTLGLGAPDAFYFGNARGESGNSAANAAVDASDEIAARNNPRTFSNHAPIDSKFDFNRDGYVNAVDQIIARSNATTALNVLQLISPASGLTLADSDELQLSDIAWGLLGDADGQDPSAPWPTPLLAPALTLPTLAWAAEEEQKVLADPATPSASWTGPNNDHAFPVELPQLEAELTELRWEL